MDYISEIGAYAYIMEVAKYGISGNTEEVKAMPLHDFMSVLNFIRAEALTNLENMRINLKKQ